MFTLTRKKKEFVVILIYVDDFVIIESDQNVINALKTHLKTKFNINDLRKLKKYFTVLK
jgi:Reverse transcriptase (RNA-dependent DNA polymerase)